MYVCVCECVCVCVCAAHFSWKALQASELNANCLAWGTTGYYNLHTQTHTCKVKHWWSSRVPLSYILQQRLASEKLCVCFVCWKVICIWDWNCSLCITSNNGKFNIIVDNRIIMQHLNYRYLFHFVKPHCTNTFETNTFDCDKPSLMKCK